MAGGVITFFSFTANSWIDLSLNIVQLTTTSVSVTISVVSTTTYVTQVSYAWMSFNNLDVNKNSDNGDHIGSSNICSLDNSGCVDIQKDKE